MAGVSQTTVSFVVNNTPNTNVFGTTSAIVVDWPSQTRFNQPTLLRDHGVISSLVVVILGQLRAFGSLSVDVTASRMFS